MKIKHSWKLPGNRMFLYFRRLPINVLNKNIKLNKNKKGRCLIECFKSLKKELFSLSIFHKYFHFTLK